jgi:hypothetical protein
MYAYNICCMHVYMECSKNALFYFVMAVSYTLLNDYEINHGACSKLACFDTLRHFHLLLIS